MFGKGLTGTIKKNIQIYYKKYTYLASDILIDTLLEPENSIKLTISRPPVDQLVC